MVQVRATSRGYFGGELREVGDKFDVPDDLWKDEKRRPRWAVLAAFGGKGDHDGDGMTGGSKSADTAGDQVDVPANWKELSAAEKKALAKALSGNAVPNAKEAEAIIAAHVGEAQDTAAPFADAPKPTTVPKGGIQEGLGGAEPDWLPPSDDAPVQADD